MKRLYLRLKLWWHDYTMQQLDSQLERIHADRNVHDRKRLAAAFELLKMSPVNYK